MGGLDNSDGTDTTMLKWSQPRGLVSSAVCWCRWLRWGGTVDAGGAVIILISTSHRTNGGPALRLNTRRSRKCEMPSRSFQSLFLRGPGGPAAAVLTLSLHARDCQYPVGLHIFVRLYLM